MDNKSKKIFTQKKSKLASLFEKVWPKSVEAKKKRVQQYRDIGIFAVSIGLFIAFEKQIREALTIDYNEIKKIVANPPQ